jgi:hypothetical protein
LHERAAVRRCRSNCADFAANGNRGTNRKAAPERDLRRLLYPPLAVRVAAGFPFAAGKSGLSDERADPAARRSSAARSAVPSDASGAPMVPEIQPVLPNELLRERWK